MLNIVFIARFANPQDIRKFPGTGITTDFDRFIEED